MREQHIDPSGFDFLNIDLQGAELMALKGLGDDLNSINAIVTEVNLAILYKGCPRLYQLDLFLAKKGFIRTELELIP